MQGNIILKMFAKEFVQICIYYLQMITEEGPTLYVVPYPAFLSAFAATLPTRIYKNQLKKQLNNNDRVALFNMNTKNK